MLTGSVVLIYVVTSLCLSPGGTWINDNGLKRIQVQSVVATGYARYDLPWTGRDLDPDGRFVPVQPPFGYVVEGRLYAQYSPVFALLSTLPYRAFGDRGLLFWPMLGGVLALPAVGRLAHLCAGSDAHRRERARAAAWVITALATPMWFYSVTFWEMTPAVCLTTWSMLGIASYVTGGSSRCLLVAALAAAGATYFRDETVLFALVAVLILFNKGFAQGVATMPVGGQAADAARCESPEGRAGVSRIGGRLGRLGSGLLPSGVFAVVFAATTAPLLLFQAWALDRPLGFHFDSGGPLAGGWTAYVLDRVTVARRLLINADPDLMTSLLVSGPALWMWGRVLIGHVGTVPKVVAGFTAAQGVLLTALSFWRERPLHDLLASNGLFSASPILLMAFAAVRPLSATSSAAADDRSSRMRRMILVVAALWVAGYVLLSPPQNTIGVHWGCRFMLPVIPLLAAAGGSAVAQAWEAFSRRARSRSGATVAAATAVGVAIVTSVGLQVYALNLLRHRCRFNAALNAEILSRPQEAILCRDWHVPQDLHSVFGARRIYLVDSPEEERDLCDRLARAGFRDALVITSLSDRSAAGTASTVLCDDPLNFTCVAIDAVPLSATGDRRGP
ncbi:MAG: hypothetical protein BroJett003_19420 [Planctomycetota bacterium]|nr:MAG: hypothetical protein BroJett003_19420 [Planctomycetota bacterium]